MKNEQASLKASNDNYVFINAKLSKSLKKALNKLSIRGSVITTRSSLPDVADFVIPNAKYKEPSQVEEKDESLVTVGVEEQSLPQIETAGMPSDVTIGSLQIDDFEKMQAQVDKQRAVLEEQQKSL